MSPLHSPTASKVILQSNLQLNGRADKKPVSVKRPVGQVLGTERWQWCLARPPQRTQGPGRSLFIRIKREEVVLGVPGVEKLRDPLQPPAILTKLEVLRQAEIVLKMVWLPKGVPEKRHSGNDRTVCELAVPVVVQARERGKRRAGAPLENRANQKPERHLPHATQYPAMTDIVSAPAVLGTEVIGVFVVDSQKVPFVRVIVPVIGQSVTGLKLEPGNAALQSYDDRIVVRTSAAFLLAQNTESAVGPDKRIESRPGHRRRRIVQCQ